MATTVTATQLPLVQLANLMGGQTTTSNAGDTTALQSALSGLQGQNYQAMLESIFQQAGGKIPGLQGALSNAVGARSGNNSPMAAALADLLKTTTMSAQDQLAKQQLANLQTQTQAGSAVAQATKGTTQKSGTDLLQAAKMLALMQGASKVGLFGDQKQVVDTPKPLAPVSDAVASTVNPFLAQDLTALNVTPESTFTGGDTDLSWLDAFAAAPADVAPAPVYDTYDSYDFQSAPDTFEADWAAATQGMEFANGGLVEKPEAVEPDDKMTPANSMVAGDSVAINLSFETFRKMLGDSLGKPEGYADGGVVKAAGSRRSANPTVALQAPETSMASVASDALKGLAGLSSLSLVGGSSGSIPAGAMVPMMRGASTYASPEVAQNLALAATMNNIAKTQGYKGLPSELGLAAGLANASTPEQAAITGAKYAATTKAGSEAIKSQTGFTGGEVLVAYNTAKALEEGDTAGAINSALWYVSPPVAAVNTLSQMLGGPDVGTVTVDTGKAVDDAIIQPVAGAVEDVVDFGLDTTGAALDTAGNIVGEAGELITDAAGNIVDAGGQVISKVGDFAGDLVGGAGKAVGSAVSDAGNFVADVFGLKSGGYIQGPGTGTSDSIPARLSDGEYVIPADVVDKVGVEFFDHLRASLHTPVATK